MKTMKPEIISRETIKPSSPTPNSQRWYKLSLLDKLNFRAYVPIVLFYPSNDPDNTVDFAHRSSGLKKSLSETLTRYYPLAGRIKDGVNVECNDEGVDFFVARVDCHLEGFLERPEFEALKLFVPNQIQWNISDLSSTLAVQITFFECGGMAIGVSVSHKVADLSTLASFITDWASMARQSGEEISAEFITSFIPPNDSLTIPEYEVKMPNCVTRRFVFNAAKLEALKALATSYGVENPTRVEVVAALISKCAIAASRASSGSRKPSVLLQMVNLRRIVIPPLPEKSFGNMVWYFPVSADAEESEAEFHGLVSQLKEGIARFRLTYGKSFTGDEWSSQILESMKESSSLLGSISTNNIVVYPCTSWCRFPFYKVDFGWGKPIWVVSPSSALNSSILMDTRTGEGIEALVTLEEQDMAVFEQDEELLRFASLNPSALDTN